MRQIAQSIYGNRDETYITEKGKEHITYRSKILGFYNYGWKAPYNSGFLLEQVPIDEGNKKQRESNKEVQQD